MLTNAPVDEWKQTLRSVAENTARGTERFAELKNQVSDLEQENQSIRGHLAPLRKAALAAKTGGSVQVKNPVSDECAEFLASVAVLGGHRRNCLRNIPSDRADMIVARATAIVSASLNIEARSALTSTDIPLPIKYANDLVQLVIKYGDARKYGTVYPVGANSAKLPRLKTSPTFTFMSMSAAIPEVSPQIELVNFPPEKAGGIIRVPAELESDSLVSLGNFLADYCARELAKWEDTVFFVADGSATYKSFKGIGKAAVDLGKVIVLGSGKTKPSDITLADLRAMRAQVASASHRNAAYYLHPSMEALLVGFNTLIFKPYEPTGPKGPTLEGYPIRWVSVLPAYDTAAHASQIQGVFGDMSYQYLAVRRPIILDTSKDVYFTTDEIAFRCVERFAVGLMADAAVSAIQLAAS